MERLLDIADDVDQPADRDGARRRRSASIGEQAIIDEKPFAGGAIGERPQASPAIHHAQLIVPLGLIVGTGANVVRPPAQPFKQRPFAHIARQIGGGLGEQRVMRVRRGERQQRSQRLGIARLEIGPCNRPGGLVGFFRPAPCRGHGRNQQGCDKREPQAEIGGTWLHRLRLANARRRR